MIDERTRNEILDAAAHADFCLAAATDGRFEARHALRDAAEALMAEADDPWEGLVSEIADYGAGRQFKGTTGDRAQVARFAERCREVARHGR